MRLLLTLCFLSFGLATSASSPESRGSQFRLRRQAPSAYYYGVGGNVIGAYTPVGLAFNPLRVAPLTNWGRKKRETRSPLERAKRTPASYSGIEANLVEQVAAISEWGRKRRHLGESIRSKRQAPSAYYYGAGGNVIGAYTPVGLAFNPLRVAPLTNWGRK